MSKDTGAAAFTGLVDLAAAEIGGQALYATDEFFAGKENLLQPGRGVFLPDEYTDRGKWMDGWESRRKRDPGHDWCVIRLGARGRLRGLDIDTNHFLGNHPPFASVEAANVTGDWKSAQWQPVLVESPLRPGSQNLFSVQSDAVFTHIRLHIYPAGGVARFRVFGEAVPDWSGYRPDEEAAKHLQPGEVDLAGVKNGGVALACSDAFFGPMNNLLLPQRAENMGGGWETRRRRGPGHDWIVVRLAERGAVAAVEVDTNHFKGNYPDRFQLHGIDAADARLTELASDALDWTRILPETKLSAHTRHFYRDQVQANGPFTHVKLRIDPDGGVSRLRIYGKPA